jgi:hypothetical protein
MWLPKKQDRPVHRSAMGYLSRYRIHTSSGDMSLNLFFFCTGLERSVKAEKYLAA